jgi:hypothetical protein
MLGGNNSTRLIDTSTANRVNPDWAYGFAEMDEGQAEAIAGAFRRQSGLLSDRRHRAHPAAGQGRHPARRLSRHGQCGLRLFGRRQAAHRADGAGRPSRAHHGAALPLRALAHPQAPARDADARAARPRAAVFAERRPFPPGHDRAGAAAHRRPQGQPEAWPTSMRRCPSLWRGRGCRGGAAGGLGRPAPRRPDQAQRHRPDGAPCLRHRGQGPRQSGRRARQSRQGRLGRCRPEHGADAGRAEPDVGQPACTTAVWGG